MGEEKHAGSLEAILDKGSKYILIFAATAFCLIELYTAFAGAFAGMKQTSMHMAFVLSLGFILYQPVKKSSVTIKLINLTLACLMLWSQLYIFINYKEITHRLQGIDHLTALQFFLAIALTVMVLEVTRRTLGWALPVIAVIFLIYQYAAPYLPGVLNYKGISLERFMEQMYLTTQGIYGEPIQVSATYVFMFVLFGAFLDKSGAGDLFMEFAKSLVGRFRGGPGLMSVVSSALMGTISGSAVANVATVGVFTIPLMRKTGYEKNFAGAVEAVSSTGGQIMPPVMGAGAFIMAEYLGMSYTEVIKAAVIPALLYFFCVFIQVYFEARRLHLPGVEKADIKPMGQVMKGKGYLSIPLIVLIYMLVRGYSAMRCGFWGILLVIAVAALKKDTRMGLKGIYRAFESATRSIIPVASACACAGIIICVVRITGIGLKFSSAVVSMAGGKLWIALLLSMVTSLILGMGLPTTASYIIQATLTAPALVEMGLLPIQAHLFVFYFACIAVITPPVALAAYTAAPLCDGNAFKVGNMAFRLGFAAFLVPFAFASSPALLMIGTSYEIFRVICTSLMGCVALSAAMRGWFLAKVPVWNRMFLFASAICLILPDVTTDIIGIVLGAAGTIIQFLHFKKEKTVCLAD